MNDINNTGREAQSSLGLGHSRLNQCHMLPDKRKMRPAVAQCLGPTHSSTDSHNFRFKCES